jgi:hypothetical protein
MSHEQEFEMQVRRKQMREKSREETTSILTLAGLPPGGMWELVNGYWPDSPIYDDARVPWWLAETHLGLIRIGWRKRVLEIDWSATDARRIVTDDDVTKTTSMVHAWSVAKAIGYLTALREWASTARSEA